MKYTEFLNQFSSGSITQTSSRNFSTNKLHIDQSSLNVDEKVFGLFEKFAKNNNFIEKFNELMDGQRLNNTENREVTHFKYRNTKSDIFEASLDKMEALASEIKHNYKNNPVNTIDGVKIELGKEWVHLRKSNTEPIIRIYAESDSKTTANALGMRFVEEIKSLI